jgi:hypothetical protein
MTECIWERSDGQRLTIRAADCFEMINDLNLNITEGELLQARLKMQVTGKSARPVIVTVRAPKHLSYGRSDGDQAARSAKMKASKAIRAAVQGAGARFEDPFQSGNGGYRLTVLPYVV